MRRSIYIRVIAIALIVQACSDDLGKVHTSESPKNFESIFEDFWLGVQTRYLYWDVDTVDWKKKKQTYRARFKELDINSDDDIRRSVSYFREMVENLLDGHLHITFTHPLLTDSIIDPHYDRKVQAGLFDHYFSYTLYDTNYLDPGFMWGVESSVSGTMYTVSGKINDAILYFGLTRMNLSRSYVGNPSGAIATVTNHFFNELHSFDGSLKKGIILDLRGNPGGDISDINFLLGQLFSEKFQFGYSQYKLSSDPYAFTPAIPAYIYPSREGSLIDKPVIVLGDRYTASLAETIIAAILQVPGNEFIGENTYGATGPVVLDDIYEGGPFSIPFFMNIRMSSAKFYTNNFEVFEGVGIQPALRISHSLENYTSGIDLHLEAAIDRLSH